MKKFVLLLSLSLPILRSNICDAQTGKWKIIGQLKNQEDTALFAASVFISNSTKGSMTDSNGNFSITGLSNGNYNVIVSSIGYATQIYPITIDNKTIAYYLC